MKEVLGQKLYSALEVSELLGVSLFTVRKYIHNGTFESIKLGGRFYIEEQELKKFLAPQNRKTAKSWIE